ncbi:MAG: hypothetical protein KGH67_02565, partial [Candidatus Micrarchaeota archaeon]|nr:hypothetical protein [Candidatus Micrarchaeota archaeon]
MGDMAGLSYLRGVASLMRPYSIGNIALISILTIAYMTVIKFDYKFLITVLAGLLFWIVCVFLLEFLHKKVDGREEYINHYIFIVSILVLLVILAFMAPIGILILILSLISVKLYGMKVKDSIISELAFLFRPFTEIGIVYMTAAIYGYNLLAFKLIYLSGLIYLISISRNIIGDIRDMNHDKYTLVRTTIGKNGGYLLSLAFLVILAIANGINYALIPLVFVG